MKLWLRVAVKLRAARSWLGQGVLTPRTSETARSVKRIEEDRLSLSIRNPACKEEILIAEPRCAAPGLCFKTSIPGPEQCLKPVDKQGGARTLLLISKAIKQDRHANAGRVRCGAMARRCRPPRGADLDAVGRRLRRRGRAWREGEGVRRPGDGGSPHPRRHAARLAAHVGSARWLRGMTPRVTRTHVQRSHCGDQSDQG